MKRRNQSPDSSRRCTRRIAAAIAGVMLLVLLFATSASAAYEQVATFGVGSEDPTLVSSSGAAVNTTGAGGVAPGTVYTDSQNRADVLVYGPKGEFQAAWGWQVAEGAGPPEYERCGPAGEPGKKCSARSSGVNGEGVGQVTSPLGIAVDQQTGDVYVLNGDSIQREHHLIQVFTADGQPIGNGFGDRSAFGATFAETPEQLHESLKGNGIAVSDSGTVYVADRKGAIPGSPSEEFRVMTFKPGIPNDYESYAYTGRGSDLSIDAAFLALDDVGDLYVGSEEKIHEFAPGATGSPICEYKIPSIGAKSMTVDPQSGEVFYFEYKAHRVHQLSACNAEGKFTEVGQIEVLPKANEVSALAFNPNLEWDPSRPPGLLYVIDGGEPSLGHIYAPPAAIAPVVEGESVTSVTSSSAVVRAQVDPKGSGTHYVFQYISAAAYAANGSEPFAGASEAPLGGGLIAPGQQGVSVLASLVGLQPDEEYHYRVVATSHCNHADEAEVCEDIGEDRTLRTYPASASQLPDGRAYELVSPVEKHGGEVIPLDPEQGSCPTIVDCKPGPDSQPFPRQVAPNGEAIAYEGFSFSPGEGAAIFNEYISRRSSSGWQTENPSPTLSGSIPSGYESFSQNLEEGLFFQQFPSLTGSAPFEYQNLYTQATTAPLALTPLVAAVPPNRTARSGSSSPFSLVYAGASADLSHIFFEANDALTEATPFAPEAVDGGVNENNLYEWSGGRLSLVNTAPGNVATAPGAAFGSGFALSIPGSRRSVPTISNAISTDGSRVFWTSSSGQLYVRIDAASTEEIPDPGKFLTAAADGSSVLLSDGHVYDLETGTLTDLTNGDGGFQGVMGQSEDLSRIYFVDTAVLTGVERNGRGEQAEAGEGNLYLRSEGRTSYVATVALKGFESTDWEAAAVRRTAEASPNGEWLEFEGLGKMELYDADSGELICAACIRSGAASQGFFSAPVIGEGQAPLGQPRYITDAGRLVFDSADALAPLDTNAGVEDVYEYEPSGVGNCRQSGGCVSLISGGTGTSDSNFLGIDPSGKNIFFTTRDRLVPADKDELVDLYDAREGGGFAAGSEGPHSECTGEACQRSSPPQPEAGPGSLAFSGAGNLLAPAPPAAIVKPKPKPLTKAQQLARALRACDKQPKKKRSACEKTARKKYGKKTKPGKARNQRREGRS